MLPKRESYDKLVALRDQSSEMVDALQDLLREDLGGVDSAVEQAKAFAVQASILLEDAQDHLKDIFWRVRCLPNCP